MVTVLAVGDDEEAEGEANDEENEVDEAAEEEVSNGSRVDPS